MAAAASKSAHHQANKQTRGVRHGPLNNLEGCGWGTRHPTRPVSHSHHSISNQRERERERAECSISTQQPTQQQQQQQQQQRSEMLLSGTR